MCRLTGLFLLLFLLLKFCIVHLTMCATKQTQTAGRAGTECVCMCVCVPDTVRLLLLLLLLLFQGQAILESIWPGHNSPEIIYICLAGWRSYSCWSSSSEEPRQPRPKQRHAIALHTRTTYTHSHTHRQAHTCCTHANLGILMTHAAAAAASWGKSALKASEMQNSHSPAITAIPASSLLSTTIMINIFFYVFSSLF